MWKCADKVRLGGWKNGQRPKIVCIRPPTSIHTFSPTKKTFYPHLASQHRWLSTTKADDYKVKVKGAKKNDEKNIFKNFFFEKVCRIFVVVLEKTFSKNCYAMSQTKPFSTHRRHWREKTLKRWKSACLTNVYPRTHSAWMLLWEHRRNATFPTTKSQGLCAEKETKVFQNGKLWQTRLRKSFPIFWRKIFSKNRWKAPKPLQFFTLQAPHKENS